MFICVISLEQAKARIGHMVEAQILQALDVDYVDESEVFAANARVPVVLTERACLDAGSHYRG
jgi:pyridoxal biosynthesis lyase PdxS